MKLYKRPTIEYIEATITRFQEPPKVVKFKRIPFDEAIREIDEFANQMPQTGKGKKTKITLQTYWEEERLRHEQYSVTFYGMNTSETKQVLEKYFS
jgi:hypothetical protein